MPELTDSAKEEIRQFVKAERTEEAEIREKNTRRTIALITTFGIFVLGAAGSGVFFLIDSIAKNTAETAVAERLTQARILEQQQDALDKIIAARVATETAERRAAELDERAQIMLAQIREFNTQLNRAQANLSIGKSLIELGEEIRKLANDRDFQNIVRGGIEAAPSGMLAAFTNQASIDDENNQCPTGWSVFKQARGRVILGAGPGDANVSTHEPFEIGGEENVALTEQHLPEHQHLVKLLEERSALSGNGYPVWSDFRTHPAVRSPNSEIPTTKSGGNQPHNNMPPYIALYFCKKTDP